MKAFLLVNCQKRRPLVCVLCPVLFKDRTEVVIVANSVLFCVITSHSTSLLRLVGLAGQQRGINTFEGELLQ